MYSIAEMKTMKESLPVAAILVEEGNGIYCHNCGNTFVAEIHVEVKAGQEFYMSICAGCGIDAEDEAYNEGDALPKGGWAAKSKKAMMEEIDGRR